MNYSSRSLISRIAQEEYERGKKDEFESWANQKANDHDNKIKHATLEKAIKAIEEIIIDPNFSAHWTDGYVQAKQEMLATLKKLQDE